MNVEAGTRARRRNREHPNRGGLQRQSLRRPHRPSQTGVGRRRAHTDSHPPRTDRQGPTDLFRKWSAGEGGGYLRPKVVSVS